MTRDVKPFGKCGGCDVTHLRQIVEELERLSSEKWELAEQIGKDRPEHAAYVTFHGEASAYRHAAGIVRRIGGLDEHPVETRNG